jgi:hypothetical protein
VGAALSLLCCCGFCCLFEWSVVTVLMPQSNQSTLCVVTRVDLPIQPGEFIFRFVFFSCLRSPKIVVLYFFLLYQCNTHYLVCGSEKIYHVSSSCVCASWLHAIRTVHGPHQPRLLTVTAKMFTCLKLVSATPK